MNILTVTLLRCVTTTHVTMQFGKLSYLPTTLLFAFTTDPRRKNLIIRGGSKKKIPSFRSHKSVKHSAILLKFYTHILWLFKSYVLKFWPNISVQCRVMPFCAHPTIARTPTIVTRSEAEKTISLTQRNTHTCTESTSHISTPPPYPCQLPGEFLSISARAGQTQCPRWTKL